MSLILGAKQFDQLGRRGFEQRLMKLIRDAYPAESAAVSDSDLARQIWTQVVRARRYGLTDDQSAATFVMTAWLMGIDFDLRVPAITQILNAPELSARSKSQALADFTQVLFARLEASAA
jgi:hypothetical protein